MDQPTYDSHPQNPLVQTTGNGSLRELIMGFRLTQLIYVAAKLGLADLLQEGPQTPERLAKLINA